MFRLSRRSGGLALIVPALVAGSALADPLGCEDLTWQGFYNPPWYSIVTTGRTLSGFAANPSGGNDIAHGRLCGNRYYTLGPSERACQDSCLNVTFPYTCPNLITSADDGLDLFSCVELGETEITVTFVVYTHLETFNGAYLYLGLIDADTLDVVYDSISVVDSDEVACANVVLDLPKEAATWFIQESLFDQEYSPLNMPSGFVSGGDTENYWLEVEQLAGPDSWRVVLKDSGSNVIGQATCANQPGGGGGGGG